MKTLPPFISIPAWQTERERRLHRIFTCIEGRMKRGQTLNRAARWFSWYYRNRFYRCDPERKFLSCKKTVVALYYRWKNGGRIPSAVKLRYRCGACRKIAAPVLIRFVNFSADRDWPSLSAAHAAFCRRGGNYGPGRTNGRKLELTYDSLRWNLPRGCFAALQQQRKIIRRAENEIERLRLQSIAEIQLRVPPNLPRQRKGPDFQI